MKKMKKTLPVIIIVFFILLNSAVFSSDPIGIDQSITNAKTEIEKSYKDAEFIDAVPFYSLSGEINVYSIEFFSAEKNVLITVIASANTSLKNIISVKEGLPILKNESLINQMAEKIYLELGVNVSSPKWILWIDENEVWAEYNEKFGKDNSSVICSVNSLIPSTLSELSARRKNMEMIYGDTNYKSANYDYNKLDIYTLKINGGVSKTYKREVTIYSLCGGDPQKYMASESPYFDGAEWKSYSTSVSFTLSAGTGKKKIYFKIINDAGEEKTKNSSITLEPPNVVKFKIDNGSSKTYIGEITLNNVCVGEPTHYMASESPYFIGANWEPYSDSPKFKLSFGVGKKIIYLKVTNDISESKTAKDDIKLEPPLVKYFKINNNASETAYKSVTLHNLCYGDPTEYMASELSDFSDAKWLPYSENPSFDLSDFAGEKKVYFKVRNIYGESKTTRDNIKFRRPLNTAECIGTYEGPFEAKVKKNRWETGEVDLDCRLEIFELRKVEGTNYYTMKGRFSYDGEVSLGSKEKDIDHDKYFDHSILLELKNDTYLYFKYSGEDEDFEFEFKIKIIETKAYGKMEFSGIYDLKGDDDFTWKKVY